MKSSYVSHVGVHPGVDPGGLGMWTVCLHPLWTPFCSLSPCPALEQTLKTPPHHTSSPWGSKQLERDGHMKLSSLTHFSMWPWQCQEHVWPNRTSSQPWNQTATALPTHWKQTLRPVSTGGLHMLKQESSHQQPMPPSRAELPSTKYSAQCLVSSVTSCLSFRMSVTQHTMKFTLQMGS